MNILLIQPSDKKGYGKMKGLVTASIPLSLLYLASIIRTKRKDNVELLDLQLYKKPFNEIDILQKKWDVIGLTTMTPVFPTTLEILKFIKKNNPETKTIIGGSHASLTDPNEFKKYPFIDFIVRGEGEETIIELLDAIENKKDFEKIKGIIYWDENQLKINKPRPLIEDLDSLPFPAYDLIDLENYSHPLQAKKRLAVIFTSRGCIGLCTFCSRNVFSRKLRYRSTKNIVDEIEWLINNFNIEELLVTDDCFTWNKEHAINVSKEIIRRGLKITWGCSIRANKSDIEVLQEIKKAGCYRVSIGIESGNQEILNEIKKGITLEQIKDTINKCKKIGLKVTAFFMIGFPNDTKETINQTIKFAKNLKASIVKFAILTPLPGSEIFDQLKKENKLLTENWEDYRFHDKPTFKANHLTSEEIMKYYKKAYFKIFTKPKRIINLFKEINSVSIFKNRIKTGLVILKMFFK